MFSFFSTQETKYSSDEEALESTSEEDEIDNTWLGEIIFENNIFKMYATDRDFVNNIKLWSCQRDLNKEHVNILSNSISKRNYTIGTFKLLEDSNNNIRCIDGQHRIAALKKIIQNDSKFNCDLFLEIYKVNNFESEEATDLFLDANCNLNMIDKRPNISLCNVLKYFETEYPGILNNVKEGKRVNRPRIDKKMFIEVIKKLNIDYTDKDIITNLTILNNDIGVWNDKILLSKCGKISVKQKQFSKDKGCFIGLFKNCSWVQTLEQYLLSF